MVEQAGVGGQVGARRAPDRLLVDLHQTLHGVHIAGQMAAGGFDHREPFAAVTVGCIVLGLVAQMQQHEFRQGLCDEAGFARAGDAGHSRQRAQRNACVHAVQVVPVDALQLQPSGWFSSTTVGRGNLVEQIARGARFGNFAQPVGLAAVEHSAAALTGFRPHVHQPLRTPHQVEIVLDREHRIARVAQPVERVVQGPAVRRMQARRGFIEHVHHAEQQRTQLRGQP